MLYCRIIRGVEVIRKIGDKWRLYSHTGKNLGTFDSKEAAERHERAVQFFKHRGSDGKQ